MSNDTCYLERSEVRRILIGQPDESLYITEQVADINALPILTAADICIPAQSALSQALLDAAQEVEHWCDYADLERATNKAETRKQRRLIEQWRKLAGASSVASTDGGSPPQT